MDRNGRLCKHWVGLIRRPLMTVLLVSRSSCICSALYWACKNKHCRLVSAKLALSYKYKLYLIVSQSISACFEGSVSLLIKSHSAETVFLAKAHLSSVDHRDVFLTVHQCIMVCGWNATLNQEVFDCSSSTALHFLMSATKPDWLVFFSTLLWTFQTFCWLMPPMVIEQEVFMGDSFTLIV